MKKPTGSRKLVSTVCCLHETHLYMQRQRQERLDGCLTSSRVDFPTRSTKITRYIS